MQGKAQFTSKEANAIRDLLYEKARADRDRQKSIRGKLRRIGFYISDFGGPDFTAADFTDLVKSGRIKIID